MYLGNHSVNAHRNLHFFIAALYPIVCIYYSLFNHFLVYGHLSCFKYFAVKNNLSMDNLVRSYFYVVSSKFLQSKFLEVGLLVQRISAYVVLSDIAKFLSKRVITVFILKSNACACLFLMGLF